MIINSMISSSGGGSAGDSGLKAFIERSSSAPTLPDNLTSIGYAAFYGYTDADYTTLPSGITSIDASAFYGCKNLDLTSLPSGITSISESAFRGCTNLALTSLPSGVTSIARYAFYQCTNLALTSLPNGVTTIGDSAFQDCANVTFSVIPSGVTKIESTTFQGCSSITTIKCEGQLSAVGAGAFLKCPSLTKAEFPNCTASSWGNILGTSQAASACQNLVTADIGSTSSIGSNNFANCYKLQTLVLRKTGSICTLSNVSAFTNTPMRGYNSLTGTVYVPSALISTYKTATNWKTLYDGGTLTFAAIEGSQYEL